MEQEIRNILEAGYGNQDEDTIKSLLLLFNSVLVNNDNELRARTMALDIAAKMAPLNGGDVIDEAIKYKRFLLNETVTSSISVAK